MPNAKFDENGRPTSIAVSSSNGQTIVQLQADPSIHSLHVDDNNTGADAGNNSSNAMIDANSVAVVTALSSANDGTIVEIYADDLTNKLLIQST